MLVKPWRKASSIDTKNQCVLYGPDMLTTYSAGAYWVLCTLKTLCYVIGAEHKMFLTP